MYAQFSFQIPPTTLKQFFQRRVASTNKPSSVGIGLPTVSEQTSSYGFIDRIVPARSASDFPPPVNFNQFVKGGAPSVLPSGTTCARLFETEKQTYSVLDTLVKNKNKEARPFAQWNLSAPPMPGSSIYSAAPKRERVFSVNPLEAPSMAGSSSIKLRATNSESPGASFDACRTRWQSAHDVQPAANLSCANRFTIPVDETTFQRKPFTRNSTDSINTKFTADEWNGKFEGNGYFQPEQKAAKMGPRPRTRTESGSRSRGRSPNKGRPVDSHHVQNNGEPQIPVESPSSTTFSPQEWADTFKQQTFMPAPGAAVKTPLRPPRKPRGSIPKPTMGGAAALVDDSDSGNEKPLFTGRNSSGPTPPSPDAMDVDTPPATKPSTPPIPNIVPQAHKSEPVSPHKRPAANSRAASPTDAELKVNFEDLNVRDLISSMNLPAPPAAPKIPEPADIMGRPTAEAYQIYLVSFEKYMAEWDLYTSRIILHLFARKNQNDGMGSRRWLDDGGMEQYRLGLREDKIVLSHLTASQEKHGSTVKDHAILREKMKNRDSERPRKKQY